MNYDSRPSQQEEFEIATLKEVAMSSGEEIFVLHKDKRGKLVLTEQQFNIVKKVYRHSSKDGIFTVQDTDLILQMFKNLRGIRSSILRSDQRELRRGSVSVPPLEENKK